MQSNLPPSVIDGEKMVLAIMNAEHHDESKYSKEEYEPYDAYFYGGNKSYEVVMNFNKAWLHHIHNNPHHWQHWVLINDDASTNENGIPYEHKLNNLTALEMPLEYVYEMIADWWTFSWKNNNLLEMFNWYQAHRPLMVLEARTDFRVMNILSAIYEVLKMQMRLQHPEKDIPEFHITTVLFEHGPDVGVITPDDVKEDTDVAAHSGIKKDEENEEDENKFGIPELKKFPMPDRKHVKSAIRFFNYVDPKHEKELAEAILERMKEYGMSFDDFEVGDVNRFKNYIPKEELKEQEKE